ncbi:uncharacterized protein LOC103571808 isoform X2 [Microplitis demolitor]|nr:uncharacterized protein LOC103571808 isoform X2 [Microplitis demolitor]
MIFPKTIIVIAFLGIAVAQKEDDVDISSAFAEVANSFFSDESQGTNKFMNENNGLAGFGQILSGIGNLMASTSGGQNGKNQGGIDLSMLGPVLQMVASSASNNNQQMKNARSSNEDGNGFNVDFEGLMNMASMFLGPRENNNAEGILGLLPMILENFNSGESSPDHPKNHDHSAHSWYMPPILENIHVLWDHFRNSEFGQTLWKNSGLAHIIGSMSDSEGHIMYERILESFENPSARRRWIKSLTNFVADWFSHISDPDIQSRYLTTAQFVVNSFLKSQGFPKSAVFDPTKPAESLTRMINAGAKRYLNMNIDSAKYIKPAVAYVQDLIKLASEKGFIMSRVNANELSNRLSDTINNDLVSPILKTYRAYKWAVKSPKCATHILCVINQKPSDENNRSVLRDSIIKVSSFPAAWAISTKTNVSFWTLYGAIRENEQCFDKYPADCNEFHEEEIRVTTEAIHIEL